MFKSSKSTDNLDSEEDETEKQKKQEENEELIKKVKKIKATQIKITTIGFIVNPAARKGKALGKFNKLKPILTKAFGKLEVRFTKKQGDEVTFAKSLIESGIDIIISCGGDGTNHGVLNGIMSTGKKATLGFLPLGSGCDFIRSLGMDAGKYKENIEIIKNAYCIEADIGYMESTEITTTDEKNYKKKKRKEEKIKNKEIVEEENEEGITIVKNAKKTVKKYFLNISSFGASGEIMMAVNSSSQLFNPGFTYHFHSLKTSFFAKNKKVITQAGNGKKKNETCYVISICNGQFYGSGMQVSPNSLINDGKFDVCVMGDAKFLDILSVSNTIYTGSHLDLPFVYMEDKCKIYNAQPDPKETSSVFIECDGELSGKLPATWSCLPNAIKLIVPQGFTQFKK